MQVQVVASPSRRHRKGRYSLYEVFSPWSARLPTCRRTAHKTLTITCTVIPSHGGVLVDTSFFAALLSPRDFLHQRALELSRQEWDERVTTEFILLELANFLAKSSARSLLVPLVQRLRTDPALIIVDCTAPDRA